MKRILLSVAFTAICFISFAQLNMEELGKLSYSDELSDIWGYVDEAGNEYALVGTYGGLSVVDVTDPASPEEVYFGSGVSSIWRDIKTWGDYAYVSTEGGGGIFIVDLSPLPDGNITNTTYYSGSTYPFSTVHNLYIDENGKLYIFGSNNGSGGAIICDLNESPMNPTELGRFNNYYFHDGMAKDNILYGGAIYQGFFAAVDVSDPANPVVLGTAGTPGSFTHNAWVSDDGNYVFTTDEVSSGYVAAYDISDMDNIVQLDKVQSNPGSGVIPHNTHFMNDFVITSYYKDGVVIHDVSRPGNIIEVANYDTSPNYSGNGYAGCWGVYPFLPSGNIIASDIEEGLYILSVDYKHAAFVEGTVVDSISGNALSNVDWEVLGTFYSGQTDITGSFDFATLEAGSYTFQFSKEGYNTKTIEGVVLENGELTELEIEMGMPSITGISDKLDNALVRVFPNPFQTSTVIDYQFGDLDPNNASYQVFDLTGRIVEENQITGQSGSIEIGSELLMGIYFVKISNGFKSSRLIKIAKR